MRQNVAAAGASEHPSQGMTLDWKLTSSSLSSPSLHSMKAVFLAACSKSSCAHSNTTCLWRAPVVACATAMHGSGAPFSLAEACECSLSACRFQVHPVARMDRLSTFLCRCHRTHACLQPAATGGSQESCRHRSRARQTPLSLYSNAARLVLGARREVWVHQSLAGQSAFLPVWPCMVKSAATVGTSGCLRSALSGAVLFIDSSNVCHCLVPQLGRCKDRASPLLSCNGASWSCAVPTYSACLVTQVD
jgi:hypothetical protein